MFESLIELAAGWILPGLFFWAVTVCERGGVVTSSVLWTSSPKGEDSASGVF